MKGEKNIIELLLLLWFGFDNFHLNLSQPTWTH